MKTRTLALLAAGIAGGSTLYALLGRDSSSRGPEVDLTPRRADVRPPAAPPRRLDSLAPPPPAEPANQLHELPLAADAPPGDVREARLDFDTPVREWSLDADPPSFTFFDGVTRDLILASHEPDETAPDPDAATFVGRVADAPGSWLVLAHVDDAVAGTLFVPGQGLYRVRTRAGGELRMTLVDPERIPDELQPLVAPFADELPELLPPPDPALTEPLGPLGDLPPPVLADAATTVDVMVVYTPATASANGGTSGVTALINASVATANLAYQNSQVSLTLRLVRAQQTSYSESHGLATDLGRLTNTSDGNMDEVHAARAQVKADLTSLFVTGASDAAGVAYLWSPSNPGFAALAFSVVVDAYADSNLTFAHELGHNMGCGHAPGDGGGGAYAYSVGHRFTGSDAVAYRTVMAYVPGTRIPYFSNPGVNYQGVATGRPDSGPSPAYNALTLNNSRATIAAFQSGLTAADQLWVPIVAADLNGDGKTDLVWRNSSTGRVIVWFMDGSSKTSTTALWTGDPAWVPITAGDFDADGDADLVWRNSSTGRVIVWYMTGATMASSGVVWTGDAAWVPITAGDFNADGKPDLVWRNAGTGRVIVWLMNGITMTSTATLWTGDPAWVPIVARDLDGDNKTDLLWRNSASGRVIAWLLNGTTTTATPVIWAGSSAWVLRAAGPFDGDATHDLVWRNSSDGRVIVWFMNGTTSTGSTAIYQ